MSTAPNRVPQNSVTFDGIITTEDTTVHSNERNTISTKLEYFIGVMFILAAGISFSFQSCWVKFGKQSGFMPFQLLLIRGIIQFLGTLCIDFSSYLCISSNPESGKIQIENAKSQSPKNKTEWMHIGAMAILAFLTAYLNYSAIQIMPLGISLNRTMFQTNHQQNIKTGDAGTIFATFPIWTVIFAAIFLKESIRCPHIFAMKLGILGVVLIAQPQFLFHDQESKQKTSLLGVLLCLSASFMNCCVFLVLRKLKNIKASYSIYSYAMGLIAGSLLIGCVRMNEWRRINFSSWYEPTLLISLGLFGFLGQFFKTKSIQYIPAGVASLVRSTDGLFNYSLGLIFLGEKPDFLKIIGAVCVALPVIIISVCKLQEEKQKNKEKEEETQQETLEEV